LVEIQRPGGTNQRFGEDTTVGEIAVRSVPERNGRVSFGPATHGVSRYGIDAARNVCGGRRRGYARF
jgi:hypothetical protein